jgi:pantothenate kinase-related protein Tda10
MSHADTSDVAVLLVIVLLTQIEAIRSGMNPGLTMVVGPPGTGKTDVAVQVCDSP